MSGGVLQSPDHFSRSGFLQAAVAPQANPSEADADGDSLPDYWETLFGLDPLASDPNPDPDPAPAGGGAHKSWSEHEIHVLALERSAVQTALPVTSRRSATFEIRSAAVVTHDTAKTRESVKENTESDPGYPPEVWS